MNAAVGVSSICVLIEWAADRSFRSCASNGLIGTAVRSALPETINNEVASIICNQTCLGNLCPYAFSMRPIIIGPKVERNGISLFAGKTDSLNSSWHVRFHRITSNNQSSLPSRRFLFQCIAPDRSVRISRPSAATEACSDNNVRQDPSSEILCVTARGQWNGRRYIQRDPTTFKTGKITTSILGL